VFLLLQCKKVELSGFKCLFISFERSIAKKGALSCFKGPHR
jgi:hypothetical protein